MQPRLNAIRARGATQPKPEANSLSRRPGNLLSISHGVNDYGFVLWLQSAFVVYRWKRTIFLKYVNIHVDTNLKIILLDHQSNNVERSSIIIIL
ncbi:hypothetical protein ALC57_17126 [Trachymyrmex cornetzi]|uniref:Uncharacterized protein n=1 Tax=Trachymyrmex cornetzi TaxID=471704 RepID=A0A195DCA5_9HYME|nr:hypothetical protein ALC57_17126 [Trachymyrmex cornetzi]